MKPILPFLLFIIITVNSIFGQITTPIVKANFGIEADASSNYYNNLTQPAVDDWFSYGYTGTGQFIIDTTGAASLIGGYISNPATRKLSFSKLMRQAPYSLVNNRLLLDAIFHRDFHGNDSTVYASGSNKNGMTPASWTCPVAQGIPDKNDILDAATHIRRAGPNVTDSLWMFSSIALENTTGSRYFDFELYQTDISYNRATRTFQNYGPDAGHTSWKFDVAGNIISPGDIIFTAEFGSSTLTLVQARIWIKQTSLSITPTAFNWGGQFDGDGSGAVYGYASILPKTAGAFYTGLQSTVAATWAGPFRLVREDNSLVTSFVANQFMEFSVNLTKLGIDPGTFSNNGCGTPFRRVLIKTRASTSFTAELKDFIAPFRMFDYPQVDADTYVRYYCGSSMPTVTISVYNPISTSVYTWSTSNGNIVGSNIGSSIQVNAPGLYRVTQQLYSQCPMYAQDTVSIFFDSVCAPLNINIKKFNVTRQKHDDAAINWQINNNELVNLYELEYSLDNRTFSPLVSIPADGRTGLAEYEIINPINNFYTTVIYYRLKVVGKNAVIKYSETIALELNRVPTEKAIIFPNPFNNIAWISLEIHESTEANIFIMDNSGRLLISKKVQLKKGTNLLYFDELAKKNSGIYFVKIKAGNYETIQKVAVIQ